MESFRKTAGPILIGKHFRVDKGKTEAFGNVDADTHVLFLIGSYQS